MARYDWLVVGAGLSGATIAERVASQLGQRVLVVERRAHVAGNTHDAVNTDGVFVHQYGPHAFHTNSDTVWGYLSRFTTWRPYEHRVQAFIDGVLVPLPFNLDAVDRLFPGRFGRRLSQRLIETFGEDARIPILRLLETDDARLKELATFIYEKVFVGYNVKQWGFAPDELDRSVSGRVPVVVGRDDRYFTDRYQAIPEHGYTTMVHEMLSHPNITVATDTDYREIVDDVEWSRMAYTGAIDAFFDNCHGALPYRSLEFVHHSFAEPIRQPVAQLNFPDSEVPYTRITEHKHLTGQINDHTTLTYEYPREHVSGQTEPFYPIPRQEHREVHARYEADAKALGGRVIFLGRLADYRYYNMDQAVLNALAVFRTSVAPYAEYSQRSLAEVSR